MFSFPWEPSSSLKHGFENAIVGMKKTCSYYDSVACTGNW